MEDVIFAGTEKLGEKGFAEVYLVFDLGDNNNFNSSEVSIGRKLYRDGTSEYFMNGLTCRLLDIQEFLNDVGIGKQQHIIISQGQITEILNAKPEDHRITIEEAISTERQLSLERINEQSTSELKRYTNQIYQNNNQISQLSKLIIDKKEIVTVNSKKIESLNLEIEDVKSKQSSSLEVNEALLKNEIKFLKNDLSSKTDILDKFTDNLNNWIKDEKIINKHLMKHDKFLNRKKIKF